MEKNFKNEKLIVQDVGKKRMFPGLQLSWQNGNMNGDLLPFQDVVCSFPKCNQFRVWIKWLQRAFNKVRGDLWQELAL